MIDLCLMPTLAVNIGFDSQSSQTKDHENGICCISAKHAALVRAKTTSQDDVLMDMRTFVFGELTL